MVFCAALQPAAPAAGAPGTGGAAGERTAEPAATRTLGVANSSATRWCVSGLRPWCRRHGTIGQFRSRANCMRPRSQIRKQCLTSRNGHPEIGPRIVFKQGGQSDDPADRLLIATLDEGGEKLGLLGRESGT